eukprot:2960277-Rhodomonas_salina.1
MRWIGHVVSCFLFPSCDSLTASFIRLSNISSVGSTVSHPAGAFLDSRCNLLDMLNYRVQRMKRGKTIQDQALLAAESEGRTDRQITWNHVTMPRYKAKSSQPRWN